MTAATFQATFNSTTKTLLAGQDGNGNLSPAHMLTDSTGVEKGVSTNPVWVAPVGVTLTATSVALTPGSSTQLIGPNPARKTLAVFFLANSATGYLTPGAAATPTNGIPLGAAPSGSISLGQAYTWEGSSVPTGAVNMFCASAANVIVWEGT